MLQIALFKHLCVSDDTVLLFIIPHLGSQLMVSGAPHLAGVLAANDAPVTRTVPLAHCTSKP